MECFPPGQQLEGCRHRTTVTLQTGHRMVRAIFEQMQGDPQHAIRAIPNFRSTHDRVHRIPRRVLILVTGNHQTGIRTTDRPDDLQ